MERAQAANAVHDGAAAGGFVAGVHATPGLLTPGPWKSGPQGLVTDCRRTTLSTVPRFGGYLGQDGLSDKGFHKFGSYAGFNHYDLDFRHWRVHEPVPLGRRIECESRSDLSYCFCAPGPHERLRINVIGSTYRAVVQTFVPWGEYRVRVASASTVRTTSRPSRATTKPPA